MSPAEREELIAEVVQRVMGQVRGELDARDLASEIVSAVDDEARARRARRARDRAVSVRDVAALLIDKGLITPADLQRAARRPSAGQPAITTGDSA